MIRSGISSNQAAVISDSDSDWDTTVDFPSPRAGGDDPAQDNADEDIPPTPKTRSTVRARDDDAPSDTAGAPPVYARRDEQPPLSARHDEQAPVSARREKTAVSASNILLSAQGSAPGGSRNPSPVPPFTSGFRNALHNGSDVETSRADPPPGKDRKGNIYDPTPSRHNLARQSSGGLGSWDDSDAEQRTLRELHSTLRKEKNREIEIEAARSQARQQQDDGDASPVAGRSTSVLEKWMQGRDDKRRQKTTQDSARSGTKLTQQRKSGVSSPPMDWVPRGDNNENAVAAPYRSMVVKDPDGKRYLYYFNEGSTAFYEVEETETDAVMPKVAEKVETYIRRGWQEFFGVLRIVTSFAILMVVEAANYVISHIASPIIVGIITTFGNRLIKPLLAGLFNFILQPVIIFFWNVLSGIRHIFQPLVDILGAVMSKLAVLVQAFRLVEVRLGEDYLLRRRKGIGLRSGVSYDTEIV